MDPEDLTTMGLVLRAVNADREAGVPFGIIVNKMECPVKDYLTRDPEDNSVYDNALQPEDFKTSHRRRLAGLQQLMLRQPLLSCKSFRLWALCLRPSRSFTKSLTSLMHVRYINIFALHSSIHRVCGSRNFCAHEYSSKSLSGQTARSPV